MKTSNANVSSQEKQQTSTNVSNPPTSKRHNSSGKYELSEQAFPFQACPDDFMIDFSNAKKRPLIKGTIQYTFNAHYHSLPVAVACLYKSSSNVEITNFREKIFEYELYMSDRLAACRSMNTYLYSFEAPMESQFKLAGTKITYIPAFCMVLPANGCMGLKDYMKACEEKYITTELEPIHPVVFAQIAISLFAMLRDAHLQRIGLLNISVESLKISIDNTLYFDDFKWCLELDVPSNLKEKSWIQLEKLACPESEEFNTKQYHESADVFAAATVLVNLIKIPNGSGPPYFKYPHTREVRIFISRIRPAFLMYEDILRRCLSFDPKQRPTASELLTWFETQLKTSLSNS